MNIEVFWEQVLMLSKRRATPFSLARLDYLIVNIIIIHLSIFKTMVLLICKGIKHP